MAEERTFFRGDGCLVTNTRFSTDGQTYAMANVTSVKTKRDGLGTTIMFALFTLFCILVQAWVGVLICGVLAIGAYLLRQSYVVLHTAGAEQKALSSRDNDLVERVVDAINQAIIHRG